MVKKAKLWFILYFVKFWIVIQFSVMEKRRVVIKLLLNCLIQFDKFFPNFRLRPL